MQRWTKWNYISCMQTSPLFEWKHWNTNRKAALREKLINIAKQSILKQDNAGVAFFFLLFELSFFVHIVRKIIFNYKYMLYFLFEGSSLYSVHRIDWWSLTSLVLITSFVFKVYFAPTVHSKGGLDRLFHSGHQCLQGWEAGSHLSPVHPSEMPPMEANYLLSVSTQEKKV